MTNWPTGKQTALMIEAHGLTKRFGSTVALAGLDLEVPAGSILGVLGPNGAGKTTAIRILTTLSIPDSGWARVAGYDVVADAAAVQRSIGVTAQDATLDELLTGRQNLVMIGRLSGLRRGEARTRATSLLEHFGLDEPTTGLAATAARRQRSAHRAQLGAHCPGAAAALGRDNSAGAVHRPVRLCLRV